jgi:uncharacterized repeat protein (TIGR02543 family)
VKKNGFLSFLMVFCCTLATVILSGGCDDSANEITKLAAPNKLKIDGTTLSWNAVENALSYEITFGSEIYPAVQTWYTSYDVDYIRTVGTYHIKVRAKAPTDLNYIDSDWSQNLKWERTPIQITVAFNTNGGEINGDVPDISVYYGDPYGDLPVDVTKAGYTFDGWMTGSYTLVTDESICDPFTGTAVTLTAKWTANKYTISFVLQSGDESPPDQEVTFGDPYGPLPSAAWGNNTFADWYTAAGGGTVVAQDTIVRVAGDHTLYARWTIRWELSFDLRGGTSTIISTRLIKAGDPLPNIYNTSVKPWRTGYAFDGFYTEPNGGGARYYNDQLITIDETRTLEHDTTLYAQWIPREYGVILNPENGEYNNSILLLVKYGQIMPTHDRYDVPIPIPSRPYYEFTGYFSGQNGYGTKYYDADMLPVNIWNQANLNSVSLYAGWQGVEYTIHLDPAGGALPAGAEIQTVRYGSSYKLPVPAKTGYTFVAWRGYANETTTAVTSLTDSSGASLSSTPWRDSRADEATLTALWTPNRYRVILSRDGEELKEYTVSFNLNYTRDPNNNNESDSGTPATQTVTWNKALTYPPAPSRFFPAVGSQANYFSVFLGWFECDNPDDPVVSRVLYPEPFDFTRAIDHNVRLFAKWARFSKANYNENSQHIFTPDFYQNNSTEFCTAGRSYAFVSLRTQTLTFRASTTSHYANSKLQLFDTASGVNVLGTALFSYSTSSYSARLEYKVEAGVVYYFKATWDNPDSMPRYKMYIDGTKDVPLAGGKPQGDVKAITATFDAAMPANETAPTKAGFTFIGYFTKLNGGGVQYYNANMTSARTWDIDEDDVILYAWWN